MSDLSITIKILDKELPLRVKDAQQEAAFRLAGDIINDKIKKLKAKGHTDKTILLAMAAFDTALDNIRAKRSENRAAQKLDAIDSLLAEALS